MPDLLHQIEEDVRDLKDWAARHEERHGDEADMLQLVLQHLNTHTQNHHSKASTVRLGTGIGAVLAVLAVLAEVIRQVLL